MYLLTLSCCGSTRLSNEAALRTHIKNSFTYKAQSQNLTWKQNKYASIQGLFISFYESFKNQETRTNHDTTVTVELK